MNDESKDTIQDDVMKNDVVQDDTPEKLTRREFMKLTFGAYMYFLPFFAGLIAVLLMFYLIFRFVL